MLRRTSRPALRRPADRTRAAGPEPDRRPAATRILSVAVLGGCLVLLGWMWRDAQVGGYVGLPVNVLGQIIGDLLLMSIVAPFGAWRRMGRTREPVDDRMLVHALTRAKHRIQLMDLRLCLSRIPLAQQGVPGDSALTRALIVALDRGVYVEVLLPDPDTPAGCQAARDLGLDASDLRTALRNFVSTLTASSAPVRPGRLDLRVHENAAAISFVRCDEHVWAALHPEAGSSPLGPAPAYLSLDHANPNAQALQSYVSRVHAAARPVERTVAAAVIRER